MTEQGQHGESAEPPFDLHSISDVLSWPDPRWLIDKILPEASFAVLYGPPNVGTKLGIPNLMAMICLL